MTLFGFLDLCAVSGRRDMIGKILLRSIGVEALDEHGL